MQSFFDAYVEAALWSSNDESRPDGGDPMDQNYVPADLSRETFARMLRDCEAFQAENEEFLTSEYCNSRYGVDAQAGHDFWLTRNHHGAGFWDGDWEEPAATKLTDSAHKFGEYNLYVGDDGKIYGM